MAHRAIRFVFALAAVACFTAAVEAQQPTVTKAIKTFEVIAVDGNTLVVKLPEGTREITVPEDFRFTVDGQQLSVHDLKAGMKGTAAITTKTTMKPVVITEVKNGTVMDSSGGSIIVRTDNGIQMFTQGALDKRGVKIMKDGQPAQISDLRKGDNLTAVIVTTKPPQKMTEQQVEMKLAKAAAAPATTAGAPAKAEPIATSRAPKPAGTAPEAGTPKKLPKTASSLPLFGLGGAALLAMGLALTTWRRIAR